jgi:hypothetical protein
VARRKSSGLADAPFRSVLLELRSQLRQGETHLRISVPGLSGAETKRHRGRHVPQSIAFGMASRSGTASDPAFGAPLAGRVRRGYGARIRGYSKGSLPSARPVGHSGSELVDHRPLRAGSVGGRVNPTGSRRQASRPEGQNGRGQGGRKPGVLPSKGATRYESDTRVPECASGDPSVSSGEGRIGTVWAAEPSLQTVIQKAEARRPWGGSRMSSSATTGYGKYFSSPNSRSEYQPPLPCRTGRGISQRTRPL